MSRLKNSLDEFRESPYSFRNSEMNQGAVRHWACPQGDEFDSELPESQEGKVVDNWESYLSEAFTKYVTNIERASLSLALLRNEQRIEALEEKVDQIAQRPFGATIATLTPHKFKAKRDIPVLVRFNGDDYYVSFVDANIGASGETVPEAIDNLKDALVATFKFLNGLKNSTLGPSPKHQLAVLKEFIEAQ